MKPPTQQPLPAARAAAWAAQAIDRISSFLRRVSRIVTILAAMGLVGGAALWWVVSREAGDEQRLAVSVAVGIVLLVPPVVLGLFAAAVRAIVALPQRLRESPQAVREHADELGRGARAVAEARSAGPLRTLVAVVRLVRTAGSSRELLGSLIPGALLLNPARLILTALAGVAALVEIVLGAAALVWLVLS
jgi:hypothetical protein